MSFLKKMMDYEVSVCFKCHKDFSNREDDFQAYCPICRNFGSRTNYYLIIAGFLFYLSVNLFDIVSDFANLNLTRNSIFATTYLSALFYFVAVCLFSRFSCKKVGKKK